MVVEGKDLLHSFTGNRIRRWLNARIAGRDWLRRFLRGSFWHSLGTITAKLIGLLTNFVLARILGVDGFGRISFVQTSITTASAIASFGLGMVTTKHVAEYRQQPARLGGAVTLALLFATLGGALVGLTLVAFSGGIADLFLTQAEAPYIRITGYGVLFAVVVLISTNVLIGLEAFKKNAFAQLATGVITCIFTVFAAWCYGVTAAIHAFVISLIAAFAINLVIVGHTLRQGRIRLSLRGAIAERGILLRYSLPSFLSGVIVVICGWLARAIIIKTNGFSAFGIYAAANQFFLVLTTLNAMFGAVLLPVYISHRSERRSTSDNQELDFFNLMFAWTFSVIALGLILVFSDVIGAMLGQDYRQPIWSHVLGLVLLSACIVAHRQGVIRIILEKGLMWFALFGNIIWAALVMVFAHWFKADGALGLAFAVALAYVINTLLVCPLYYAMDLVPRYFLFSVYSWLVWLGVLGMVSMPWLTDNLWLAKLGVLLCYLVSLGGLHSLWRNRKELCDSSCAP